MAKALLKEVRQQQAHSHSINSIPNQTLSSHSQPSLSSPIPHSVSSPSPSSLTPNTQRNNFLSPLSSAGSSHLLNLQHHRSLMSTGLTTPLQLVDPHDLSSQAELERRGRVTGQTPIPGSGHRTDQDMEIEEFSRTPPPRGQRGSVGSESRIDTPIQTNVAGNDSLNRTNNQSQDESYDASFFD